MSSSSPTQPGRRLHKAAHTLHQRTESDSSLSRPSNTMLRRHNAQGTLPPPQVPGAGSSSEQQQQPRRRPSPPLRLPSYSKPKRHASFDTPREVPLPSPSLLGHESQFSYFSSPMGHDSPEHSNRLAKKSPVEQQHPESFEAVFEERDAGWTSIASKRSTNGGQLHDLAQQMSTLSSPSAPSRSQSPAIATPSQPIHPFPRPYSLPHSQSSSAAGSSNGSTVTSLGSSHLSSKQAGGIDRSSSASLPLPSQIPFHTLPKVGSAGVSSLSQPPKHRLAGDADLSAPTAAATLGSLPETESEDRRGPSVSPTNFSTLPPTPPTTTDPSSLTSWLQSTVLPSTRPSSQPAFTAPQPPWLRAAAASPYHSTSTQRSSYPFVEPDYLDNASSYATALPKKTSPGSGLGMSRPPPEPPTILPAPPIPQEQHQYPPYPASAASPHTDSSPSTSGSSAASLASSTGMASTDTGLTSPASLSGSHAGGLQRSSSRASQPPAYAPFLSNAPPPADSWIEVETTGAEYRLNVRLPGFKRDGITLATKRRRILHVVADSWENGGGHFERRISFGYDADLVQVRAEFDGEMLRVIIPRRNVSSMGGGLSGSMSSGMGMSSSMGSGGRGSAMGYM